MAAVELTVFHVILLFWSLRTAESQVMVKTGCESNCGGVEIPYPFGMKEGCFLDERFKIQHCNSSSGYPTLTVNGTDLVVRLISVYSSRIYVNFPMFFANCGGKDTHTVVDLEGSPFVFSSENYFVASGCDNLALMNQNNSAIGGCVSICDKSGLSTSGCSGINCCQTRIPSNLKVFNVTMTGVDGRDGSGGEKNCRHAYLSNYGGDPYDDMKYVDWGIDRRAFESLVNTFSFNYTSTLLFLFIGLWWLYKVFKRKRGEKLKKKYFKRNGGLLLQEQLSSGEVNVEKIKMFPSKELDKATDHYNANRTLGQGGQGTVYKGMLADGKIVAVKKSKVIDEGNLRQFINEVTELPLLVYEFIPNGTLFQFLHDPNEEFPLTWEMRIRIATEVAGALFYLHSAASIAIFHRDIKSANILLDEKYRAKVADFGTSRSVSVDQTHVTTLVQGTFGYLDPEYFQSSQFTDKSDVYSFGVVLVELLTGQKAISFTRSEEQGRSLATYFLMAMESNCLFDILDPQVVKQGKKEDVVMVASLARSCLRLNGKERPTMKEVTTVLERIQKSDNLIVQREIEYDRNEVMGAPWDATCPSTISSFRINLEQGCQLNEAEVWKWWRLVK
ncbi:wall-associated receptor kinase [Salix suchowensis]|nr:wall-associated receptor kinase [Salix suchowensis]